MTVTELIRKLQKVENPDETEVYRYNGFFCKYMMIEGIDEEAEWDETLDGKAGDEERPFIGLL